MKEDVKLPMDSASSDRSPLDDKKRDIGVENGEPAVADHGTLPFDPDADCSPEERARIVWNRFEQSLSPPPLADTA